MPYDLLRLEVSEGVATVTINRPDKLNALNNVLMGDLDRAFEEVEAAAEIRGLILTGAGEKAFVAGADIRELASLTPAEAERMALRGQGVFRRLETMGKPSIAAVNGFALGGGLELAMACALRVASENAKFGQPEIKLGIIPGYGGSQRLPRLVGRGRALEMLLTGAQIDAAEAHRIGLVNHVVPQQELGGFCRGLMSRILENAPLAAGLILNAVDAGLSGGLEEGLRFEAACFALSAATEDKAEGTAAFVEKRKPVFRGR
ncbi:MAG TPA: enoyl-CoA hydratase-related protein [Bryobacteraceae bacterium]|nr:enoyl-CoA hydratase-related protein [Bryobacteraceae bacterium]